MVALEADDIYLFKLGNNPVPVELTSFIGVNDNGFVRLNWTTATEKNNAGFEVQRSTDREKFENIGYVNGFGTTAQPQHYTFVDKDITSNKYYYRLRQVDYDGTISYSPTIEVDNLTPVSFEVYSNYPNPFNPTTTISFALIENSNVAFEVFNVLGQQIFTKEMNSLMAGYHKFEFDASTLTSGVYIYQVRAVGESGSVYSKILKMNLIK